MNHRFCSEHRCRNHCSIHHDPNHWYRLACFPVPDAESRLDVRILMMLGLKPNVVHTEECQNEILVNMKRHIRNLCQAEENAWDKYIAENKETLG